MTVVAGAAAAIQAAPTSKWVTADNYKLDAFDQVEGAWPIGHPLPLPKWSNKTKEPLIIEKVCFFFFVFLINFVCLLTLALISDMAIRRP